jgi:signal transduction histidine kinase
MAERTENAEADAAARTRSVAKAIISASPDATLLLDRSGHVVAANRLACVLFGLRANEMRGTKARELLKETTRWRPATLPYPACAGSCRRTYLTMHRGNRGCRDIEVIDKQNVAPGLHARIVRDLTPFRRATDELQRRSALLNQSETVGRIGAWAANLETETFERTPGMCRMLEIPMSESVTSLNRSYAYYAPRSKAVAKAAFEGAIARGSSYDLEVEVVTGRGRQLWMRETCRTRTRNGRVVSAMGVCQDITERRRIDQIITDAQSQERMRIGADLHDELGQKLTGLAMLLKGTAMREAAARRSLAAELAALSGIASDAVASVRALAHGMLPVDLRDDGLAGALQRLAAWARRTLAVRTTFELIGHRDHKLDAVIAEHLYRIAQEAVSNAVRHGRAKHITLTLQNRESKTLLTVTDDGKGIDAAAHKRGVGLQIMRHRARMMGALIEIERARRSGTQIRCLVGSRSGAA